MTVPFIAPPLRPLSVTLAVVMLAFTTQAADPTGVQQYWLELINRMRMDPAGELEQLTNYSVPGTTFGSPASDDPFVNQALQYFNTSASVLASQWTTLTAAPALTWNSNLANAAVTYSNVMVASDLQQHDLDGLTLDVRVQNGGYTTQYLEIGEALFATAQNPVHGHAGFAIDWGDDDGNAGNGFGTGIQNPATHREDLMNVNYKEVGIGFQTDSLTGNVNATGPIVTTQHFASQYRLAGSTYVADAFLTGSVYQDTVLNDQFYTPGEGIAGAALFVYDDVTNVLLKQGTTNSAGGYSILLDGLQTGQVYRVEAPSTGQSSQTFTISSRTVLYENSDPSGPDVPVTYYDNVYARFEAVPEPTSALLVLMVGIGAYFHRRRSLACLIPLCVSIFTLSASAQIDASNEAAVVIEEYNSAVRAMIVQLPKATSDAERAAIRQSAPRPEDFAGRLLAIAQKTSTEAVAVKALCWLATQATAAPESTTALDLLRTRYAASAGVWEAAQQLHRIPRSVSEPVLRAIVETNKNAEDRCTAMHALGTLLFNVSSNLDTPEAKADLAQAAELFHEVIASYSSVTVQGFKPADQCAAVLFEMENLAIGKEVPDIVGTDADGAAMKLSEYRGKAVLLIFWGGWCHSCHSFLPILRDLQTKLGSDRFSVVGVNSDIPSELKATLAKEALPWRNFADGSSSGPISSVWNIRSWPTLYLIDPQGIIVAKQMSLTSLEERIRSFMK